MSLRDLWADDARQANPLWRHAHILRCLHEATKARLAEIELRRRRIVAARRCREEEAAAERFDAALAAVELDNAPAENPWAVGMMLAALAWQRAMRTQAEGGRIGLIIEERDCDCVYSTSARLMNAQWPKVAAYIEQRQADAEGPCHIRLVAPSALQWFEPQTRDLVMEAYENGHRSTVYSPIG